MSSTVIPEGLTRDDVLDNVTLYWLTNTAVSSARLYWEDSQNPTGGFFAVKERQDSRGGERLPGRDLPGATELGGAGVSQADLLQPAAKGGHFAAWEQPESFTEELRAAFRSLR